MLRNGPNTYGFFSKTLHWVIALIILGLLSVGFYMHGLDFSPFKLQLYGWHKSFGILVLILVAVRVIWKLSNPKLQALDTHARWEKILAKAAHVALYAAMFLMPLTGWLMSSAGGFPAGFFGLFELPALTPKDENLLGLFREMHEVLAFIIIGVVALHMAGAFKHHFIDRDETLERMTARSVGFWRGALLAMAAGFLLATPVMLVVSNYLKRAETQGRDMASAITEDTSAEEMAQSAWVINQEASTIGFEATQYGQPFSGAFSNFTGEINFDPDNLGQSRAEITIDIGSIHTGSADRDEQARSAEWFNVSEFPQARFVTTSFTKLDANRYETEADLTIRGVKIPVVLPFTLEISEQSDGGRTAHMQGELTLQRLDFGIGQGQWQSAESIGNPVSIAIKLEASQDQGEP